MDEEGRRWTQLALGIATDHFNDPDGVRREFGESELARIVRHEDVGDAELVVGLVNLIGWLLVKLEKAGQDPNEILRDIGVKLAQPDAQPPAP